MFIEVELMSKYHLAVSSAKDDHRNQCSNFDQCLVSNMLVGCGGWLNSHNNVKPNLCFVRFSFGRIEQSEHLTLAKLFYIFYH